MVKLNHRNTDEHKQNNKPDKCSKIFPEVEKDKRPAEIENKFADDGIIKEIICYGEKDRIVAEIYPDYQLVDAWRIESVHEEIESIINRVNSSLNTDRQISIFKMRETPFPRTSTGKIKRAEFNFAEDETK